MSNNAHDLSNRLLNALDNNYNVVDMHAVNEIISILEKINITKELLETTRLGKHVNELRRKTSDPTLARRAKVLVKRWRDLVIPTVASPGHTGSNRSSAERSVRRLGGTPLTSPALSRVVSPAVASPRPPSRPAWGGYESDSQDVILVDDDPPAPTPAPPFKPATPPVKRTQSPAPPHDEKKAKRDKKPKKRRGYSRAGSGAEAAGAGAGGGGGAEAAPPAAPAGPAPHAWPARNGSAHSERRRNGYRRNAVDPYAALVHKMPPAGAKKVKTTKELLEEIQSRKGSKPAASPSPPASPSSPDVMLIEPESYPVKVESPLRNGGGSPRPQSPAAEEAVCVFPLEEEREREECTCGDVEEPQCPAGAGLRVRPLHVRALHHALLPGINGTRAPAHPHRFAVRPPARPDRPDLFSSVVPLYNYSDYADDYCAKNMDRVPLCVHLPWTEFAPDPPAIPDPPSPPPPRPYPPEEAEGEHATDEPDERLKASPAAEEERDRAQETGQAEPAGEPTAQEQFAREAPEHRTVERTKAEPPSRLDGRALAAAAARARAAVPYEYAQLAAAPVLAAADRDHEDALRAALAAAAQHTARDRLGRPARAPHFAEWHECARLGDLVALPYVVID